jgi:outer membrane protein OmpA-like peptidoglycan-associated protein
MNMTKLKLAVATCTAVALLAGCSTPPPTTVIGLNYDVDNAKANGIVQVFDLSGNTVVQVRDLNPKTTHFLDAKNDPISFKVIGENVVLAGQYSSFTVSTAAAASRVIRKRSAAVAEPVAVAAVATAAPAMPAVEADAALAVEIARMRKEIAELKLFLTTAAARDTASNGSTVAAAATDTARTKTSEPAVVIVSFPNNSRQFNPAQEQRARLVAISQNADSIIVHGFTDSELPTPGSAMLAKARAEAAKQYLISMGVSPAKIVVGFDPAGKFIAENRSPAGKAANRRVEIGAS